MISKLEKKEIKRRIEFQRLLREYLKEINKFFFRLNKLEERILNSKKMDLITKLQDKFYGIQYFDDKEELVALKEVLYLYFMSNSLRFISDELIEELSASKKKISDTVTFNLPSNQISPTHPLIKTELYGDYFKLVEEYHTSIATIRKSVESLLEQFEKSLEINYVTDEDIIEIYSFFRKENIGDYLSILEVINENKRINYSDIKDEVKDPKSSVWDRLNKISDHMPNVVLDLKKIEKKINNRIFIIKPGLNQIMRLMIKKQRLILEAEYKKKEKGLKK